jgi:vancomycin resistance protein YoaR
VTEEERERKERMKEYRRRYQEKHGIHHHQIPWKKGLIALGVICIVSTGGFLFAQSKTIDSVTLEGQPVANMTEEDIQQYLDERENDLNKKTISLKAQGVDETLSLKKMEGHYDRQRINEGIFLIGRSGTPIQRIADVYTTLRYGKDVPLAIEVNDDMLTDFTNQIHDTYDVEEKNAYAVPNGSSVILHNGTDRIVIDAGQLKNQILDELHKGNTGDIAITVQDRKEPAIKEKDLKGIDTVLSYYTTHFDTSAADRDANIKICQNLLTHALIPAGKAFSFNDTVGTRTRDKGYKDAPVYFDNKVVMDAGGGVCQVSTTLFNAALRAGLIIDHRAPHFAPAEYVPVGMDATVADGSLDFGFTNPFKHPIYIYTVMTGSALTVYILGNAADTCEVSFTTLSQKTLPHKVIYKHDDSVTDDVREQEGYDGHDVTIRRDVSYKDGDKYTDKIISHYDPNTLIIRTLGPSSEQTVQDTNLDGETPQDVIINKLHDMTD